MITITMLTGAALGHDRPSICHSGKPEKNRCYAGTARPGRDGWVWVANPPAQKHRDGWWCPDCAKQLREAMEQNGMTPTSSDITLPPESKA